MKDFQDYLIEARTKISTDDYKKKMKDHSDFVNEKLESLSKKQKIILLNKNGITKFNAGGKFEEPLEKTKDEHMDQMIWHNSQKKSWKWL